MKYSKFLAILLTAVFFAGCDKLRDYNPPNVQTIVVKGSGDLTNLLAQFRNLLGEPLNVTPGQTIGRREVNWDGVPAAFTNNNNFPFDFFNNTDPAGPNGRKRGLVLANTSTSFRVDSTDFSEVDASYADQFEAFSPARTFVSVGTNVTGATFKVPGTSTDAFVKGFGVIFSDVDHPGSTTIEYFQGSTSLGTFKVPEATQQGEFSFLGVYFPDNKVTRVEITAGNRALGNNVKDVSDGGTKDLVVMDDFLYSEPNAY